MDKVSIKLIGGLSNYLFEIAFAYAYAKKHNKSLVLHKQGSVRIHKDIDFYKDNILANVQEFFSEERVNYNNVHNEALFHFYDIPNIAGNVYFNGHYQTWKYFESCKEDIKKLFEFPEVLGMEILKKLGDKYNIDIKNEETCSLHVRRGDYLNSPNHHPVQNMNYYMKAIKKMPNEAKILIFSDDINWCKQNFPDIPEMFIFVEGFNDFEDFFLMKNCSHNIICNSTFSWWSAWLNDNENKVVVAPKIWFGPAYANYDTRDIYCENWIVL